MLSVFWMPPFMHPEKFSVVTQKVAIRKQEWGVRLAKKKKKKAKTANFHLSLRNEKSGKEA